MEIEIYENSEEWNKCLNIIENSIKSESSEYSYVVLESNEYSQEVEMFFFYKAYSGNMYELHSVFDCIVEKPGKTIVGADQFSKLAIIDKNEDIKILSDNNVLAIKSKKRFSQIQTLGIVEDELSKIPDMIDVYPHDFYNAIKTTGINTRKNGRDYELAIKLIPDESGKYIMVFSTNGHRMTKFVINQTNYMTNEISVPQSSIRTLMLFLEKEKTAKWGVSDSRMFFKIRNTTLSVPLSIPYTANIMHLFDLSEKLLTEIEVDKKLLIDATSKCKSIFSIKKKSIPNLVGELKNGVFTITSESDGIVNLYKVDCRVVAGSCGIFKVVPSNFDVVIKNIQDDVILIKMSEESNFNKIPIISITGSINKNVTHLIAMQVIR